MSVTLRKKFLQSTSNLSSSKFDFARSTDNYDFSSLQNDEEIREITLQLVMIRKAYDYIQHENLKKREKIEIMAKQIDKLDSTTANFSEDQSSISARMTYLQRELETLKYKLEKETQDNRSLDHMSTRMKAESVRLELRSTNLHGKLSLVKGHLMEYEKKSMRNKEDKAQSQRLLKSISEEVFVEKRNKDDLIKRLEKAANNKKEATERRIHRINRQAEIAEIAANENRNAQEIECKEQIILYQIYYGYLKYKQEKAFKGSEHAEDAFTQIRVATGISNVRTVVDRFLKKDEDISQLQTSISESENQLSVLKGKNEKLKNELNGLLLLSKEANSPYAAKIINLNQEIEEEKRILAKNKEENKFVKEQFSQIEATIHKMNTNLNLGIPGETLNDYLEVLLKCKKICEDVNEKKDFHLKELEKANNMKVLDLFKEMHPGKIMKPKYIHDTSFKEEENDYSTLGELVLK